MILARYLIEIHSDDLVGSSESDYDLRDARVLADMPARLEELEENLTDMLPESYSARITQNGGSNA